MPASRTTLTEVATGLGCLQLPNLEWAVLQRPPITGVDDDAWSQIEQELRTSSGLAIGEAAFSNGEHLAEHDDGLRRRLPRIVEWAGGRRIPGDQAIPTDLRIDHVFLISCKYLSRIVHNTSPARLFDASLLAAAPYDTGDWFESVAPGEFRAFLAVAESSFGLEPTPSDAPIRADRRAQLKRCFGRGRRLEGAVADAYHEMCVVVSERSAARWERAIEGRRAAEAMLWRLLRLSSATYFVLGVGTRQERLRLRVMTPWDWRQSFQLRGLDIEAAVAGQPQVRWSAQVRDLAADVDRIVDGHVEIRWSHGRFGGPPEAKVYLDTPHAEVPGYVTLD